MVYDITSTESFKQIGDYWINEAKRFAPRNAQLSMLGNKCDLAAQREVRMKVGWKFAQ